MTKKYSVCLTVDCTINVTVEAESEEQAKRLAYENAPNPSVCHYCAGKINLGDILEAVEAVEL